MKIDHPQNCSHEELPQSCCHEASCSQRPNIDCRHRVLHLMHLRMSCRMFVNVFPLDHQRGNFESWFPHQVVPTARTAEGCHWLKVDCFVFSHLILPLFHLLSEAILFRLYSRIGDTSRSLWVQNLSSPSQCHDLKFSRSPSVSARGRPSQKRKEMLFLAV